MEMLDEIVRLAGGVVLDVALGGGGGGRLGSWVSEREEAARAPYGTARCLTEGDMKAEMIYLAAEASSATHGGVMEGGGRLAWSQARQSTMATVRAIEPLLVIHTTATRAIISARSTREAEQNVLRWTSVHLQNIDEHDRADRRSSTESTGPWWLSSGVKNESGHKGSPPR